MPSAGLSPRLSSRCESKSRESCLEGELGKRGCGARGQEARLAHTGG